MAVLWLGFNGGTYGEIDRGIVAVVLLWAALILIVVGVWPFDRPPLSGVVTAGLLAAFASWVLLSTLWAPSAEDAVAEFNRVALYLATLVVVMLASARGSAARWTDGIAVGIVLVALIGLVSRLFYGTFELRGLPEFLPAARNRLSFPVDYWNGLAILAGVSVPLLLRAAAHARQSAARGLAMASFPVLAATLFFTSSRGGFIVALVGLVSFVALSPNRWKAIAAASTVLVGAASAVWIVVGRKELANGPLDSAAAASQGRTAALLLVLVAAALAFAWARVSRTTREPFRVPRVAGWALAASTAIVVGVALAVANPVQAFETFKRPPGAESIAQDDFAKAHLLSGGGSGRWQFWSAAADQFAEHPVVGAGAGSYESWWLEHASFGYFARDGHSLFIETLGELGVVGFLLLFATFGYAIHTGIARVRASAGRDDHASAAALSSFVAFLVGAAIDWMWELTVVSIVGFSLLALLVGPASLPASLTAAPTRSGVRFGVGVAGIAAAWLLIAAQIVPLLSEVELRNSQSAARERDLAAAADAASTARRLEPWAASPYLQLALVSEERGNFSAATRWIDEALARDERDWRLWLVSARLHTKSGYVSTARRHIRRAAQLNPLSPLFSSAQVQP